MDLNAPRTRWLAWLGILLPLTVFWTLCLRYLSDLPVTDDYDAVLLYLVHLRSLPTRAARLGYVLFHQHNEYKPIWANAVIALQWKLSGHVNFVVLSLLGDMQVILLAWLLWKCFAPETVPRTRRLALFVPVAMLLLQTNYAETLNWPMPGLQNLGVVTFVLLACWLLAKPGIGSFAGACGALALSIAASGNGFFLYPVGMLVLLQQRRFLRMLPWTLTTALCAGVYFTHYAIKPVTSQGGHAGLRAMFLLSFLGGYGGFTLPILRYASVPLGLCMLAGVVVAIRRRFDHRNVILASFGLFLLITALAVSWTRGGTYIASLSGRYKLYSDLLLVCLYSFSLEALTTRSIERQRRVFRWAVAVAFLFFLVGTAYGIRSFRTRYTGLKQGLALYHSSHGAAGPLPPLSSGSAQEMQSMSDLASHDREAIREAEKDDLYHLP